MKPTAPAFEEKSYAKTLPPLPLLLTALDALPLHDGEHAIKEQLFFITKQVFEKEKVTFSEKKYPINETQSKYCLIYKDKIFSFIYTANPRVKQPPKHVDPIARFLNSLLVFYNRESERYAGIRRVILKYKGYYSEGEDIRASTKSYMIFVDKEGIEYEIRSTNIWKINHIRFTAQTEIEMDICNTNPSFEAFRITFNGKTWLRSGGKILEMSVHKNGEDYFRILNVVHNFVDEGCRLKSPTKK